MATCYPLALVVCESQNQQQQNQPAQQQVFRDSQDSHNLPSKLLTISQGEWSIRLDLKINRMSFKWGNPNG